MFKKKDSKKDIVRGYILVVDNDPTISEVIRVHFGGEGYEVDTCSSYDDFSSMSIGKYALVIINLDLGDMGYALRLVETVKQQNATARTGVITCSENMSPSLVIDSLNAGADDYLLKPFSLRELMARVRAVLRRQA